jgi:hypothetical protein
MINGQERRHTDSEAARRRRLEQQQAWEQGHASADHISEGFAQALGALIIAAHRLPVCDRAAKLYAALNRLANAADKAAAWDAALALLAASELALEEDPWFRFHRSATEAVATLSEAA